MRSYTDKRLDQLWLIFCMYEMRQNPSMQKRGMGKYNPVMYGEEKRKIKLHFDIVQAENF